MPQTIPYHVILVRQLKHSANVTDAASLDKWLASMPLDTREQVSALLQAVHASYVQFDHDLQLHSHNLELLSLDLAQSNEKLRKDSASQCAAIETLRQTANSLLEQSGMSALSPADQSLEALSALIKQLIQERATALEESHKNQERLQLAIDSTDNGLWDWNVADQHVYFNPRWFEMLGYTSNELPMTFETWKNLSHPIDMEEIEPILKAHLAGLTSDYQVEFRMRHKNGEWRWIRSRGKVVTRGLSHQPLRMVGTHTDITLQRRHEQEIREKLHFIEELLEIIPNPVYFKNLDGKYLGFNKAFGTLFGKSRKNWVGQDVYALFDAERAAYHHQLDMQLYAQGGVQTFEAQVVSADGSIHDVIYSKAIFSKADGTPDGILGIITDITERKHAELELQAAKNAAEAANRAKSDFLANMSHEIRTPMNGIIGMTDLTLGTKLDSDQREYLRLVKISADSLLEIINDILDFSKIEAGRLQIEQAELNLWQTVEESIKPLQLRASDKHLKLLTTIDERIPRLLIGDPLRIRQVLINLVGNAIKFTHQGEINVNVTLEQQRMHSVRLHFSVRDTGIGIPADKLDQIFESFSQADTSTTRKFGGTGLGLTISRRLVELMAGKLWVESVAGSGSTFHFCVNFTLPSAPLDAVSITAHAEHGLAAAPNDAIKLHILLAEDNAINQKLALTLLAKMGHTVELACNGLQAVELYQKNTFDVVLMDVQMPEMGGFEATEQIRYIDKAQNRHTPIIALTAYAMQGDEQKCLAAGMDDYLTKPLDKHKLQNTLQRFAKPDRT